MRRMSLVGTVLAEVFALSALVATAAQAQPQFEVEPPGVLAGVASQLPGEIVRA